MSGKKRRRCVFSVKRRCYLQRCSRCGAARHQRINISPPRLCYSIRKAGTYIHADMCLHHAEQHAEQVSLMPTIPLDATSITTLGTVLARHIIQMCSLARATSHKPKVTDALSQSIVPISQIHKPLSHTHSHSHSFTNLLSNTSVNKCLSLPPHST